MPALDEALSLISKDEIVELSKRLIRVPSVTGEEKIARVLSRIRGIYDCGPTASDK